MFLYTIGWYRLCTDTAYMHFSIERKILKVQYSIQHLTGCENSVSILNTRSSISGTSLHRQWNSNLKLAQSFPLVERILFFSYHRNVNAKIYAIDSSTVLTAVSVKSPKCNKTSGVQLGRGMWYLAEYQSCSILPRLYSRVDVTVKCASYGTALPPWTM